MNDSQKSLLQNPVLSPRHALLLGSSALVSVAMVCLATSPSFAQTWDGDTSSDFSTGTNWSGNTLPGAGDTVTINTNGFNAPSVNASQTVNVLNLDAGDLTINAGNTLTATTSIDVSGGTVSGAGTLSTGVLVNTGGTITVGAINADQHITAIGGSVATSGATGISAINAGTGKVSVSLNAAGGVINNAGRGVEVTTVDGGITIDGAGGVSGINGGIFAVTQTGSINISGTGDSETSGNTSFGTRDRAISAQILSTSANGSDVVIDRSGAIQSNSTGTFNNGVLVEHLGQGTGDVTVTTGAGGVSVSGGSSFGIHVNRDSVTGSGNITIDTRAGAISNTGTGTTKGIFGALSSDGTGVFKIDSGAISTSNTTGHGIHALVTGDSSSIDVTSHGTITGGTKGIEASNGFDANGAILNNSLSGDVHVTTNAVIGDGTAAGNPEHGIVARGGNGKVEVDANADIHADGQAIFAQIVGTGSIDIDTSGQTLNAGGVGIFIADLKAGQLDIATGAINATTLNGVEASFGTGVKSITTNGAISAGQTGIKSIVNNGAGKVTVTANANVSGISGRGIDVKTGTGDIDVKGNGIIYGGTQGLVAESTSGNIHLTMDGFVRGIAGDALAAITSGDIVIDGNNNVQGNYRAISASSSAGSITISGKGFASVLNGPSHPSDELGAISATISGGTNKDILINRTDGPITKTSSSSNRGIHAVNKSTGTGKITVDLSGGTGTGYSTVYINGSGETASAGIYAERRNGSGKVDIDSGGVSVTGSKGFGIEGLGYNGSSVEITNHGTINGGHIGIGGFTYGSGDVTIETAADIGNTDAPTASGIHARADGSGNVSVTANNNVTSSGEGIHVDNALNNGTGNASVTGTGTASGSTYGINAKTTSGAISVTGTGATSADGTKGRAIRTEMSSTSSTANGITINRTGDATTTGSGATRTVSAYRKSAGAGDISVTVGNVTDNNGTSAHGIDIYMENVSSSGKVIANSTAGAIDMNGGGSSKGIYAVTDGSGKIDVDSGATDTNNTTGHGIHAVSSFSSGTNAAAIEIDTFGAITGGAIGIEASHNNGNGAGGTIDITTGANIGGSGSGNPATAGIKTSARDGLTTISVGSAVSSGGKAIDANASGAGSIVISGAGNLTGSTRGIGATTNIGGITITGSGTISTSADGSRSIDANVNSTATNANGLTINRTGTITNSGGGLVRGVWGVYRSAGSQAMSITTGDINITNGANTNAIGVHVNHTNKSSTGTTTVDTTGGTLTVNGAGAKRGIQVSTEGTGKVIVKSGAVNISGTSGLGVSAITGFEPTNTTNAAAIEIDTHGVITGGGIGVNASVEATGAGGDITINTHANIGSGVFSAPEIAGIQTVAIDGTTTVTLDGNVASNGDGIKSTTTGNGAITITGSGDVTGGSDAGDDGIDVTAQGAVTVSVNGTVTGDPGIVISSANGPIDVTGTGDVVGNGGDGIQTTITNAAASGAITINRDGDVTGTVSGISADNLGTGNVAITSAKKITGGSKHAIATSTQTGSTTIALNFGADVSSTSGKAILNNEGNSTTTVAKGATVAGEISLGDGDDNLTFENGGFNNVTIFDGGDDISAADGFVDVLTLNGFGTVTGANIRNWEQFNIGADLTVNGGGTLGAGKTTITNGGTLNAGNGLILAGDMIIAAGGTFNGTGGGSGVYAANGNVTNNGNISLSDGTSGDVFTVNGNYTGGGSLSLDTELNDGTFDITDRLAITGDSMGATVVNIAVSGGAGGSTGSGTTDGIQIVSVGGTSTGTFTLGNAVSIGAFNYDLVQADSQNWFLQSGKVTNQVAAYSGMQATYQQSLSTFRQRIAGGRSSQAANFGTFGFNAIGAESQTGSGFWMKSGYSDVTAIGRVAAGGVITRPEFRTRQTTVQMGYDRQFDDIGNAQFTMGIFGEYQRTNQTVNNSSNTEVSTIESDSYGGGLTATLYDPSGLYLDFVGQMAIHDVKITDKVTGATADPNVFSYSASTEVGYSIGLTEAVRLVPQAQVMFANSVIDNFIDSAGISVKTDNRIRTTGRVGLGFEYEMPGSSNEDRFAAYSVASVIHDFSDKYRFTAAGTNVTTRINPTRFEGLLGASWQIGKAELVGEIGITQSFADSKDIGYKGSLGLKFAF